MDNIIHCKASLNCNAVKAFKLFTNNVMLESWLSAKSDVVAELGGRYELFWTPEDRQNNSTIGCKITAIEHNQLLAFEWRSPIQFKHFANNADPLTHVTVSFISTESGVDIHLVHSGWRSSSEWEEAREWQKQAWNRALENLLGVA